jgi:hypothetical protein
MPTLYERQLGISFLYNMMRKNVAYPYSDIVKMAEEHHISFSRIVGPALRLMVKDGTLLVRSMEGIDYYAWRA